MFEEIKNINTSNKDIRSFGITIGIILFIISATLFYYDKSSYQIIAYIGGGFIALGIYHPNSFKAYLYFMDDICCYAWLGNDKSNFKSSVLYNYYSNWFVNKINRRKITSFRKRLSLIPIGIIAMVRKN